MDTYIKDANTQNSKLDWHFPFQRVGTFPLDRSSVFSSIEDAINYASGDGTDSRKLGGTAYCGQMLSVYDEETDSIRVFVIDMDRTLKEIPLSGYVIDGGGAKEADPEGWESSST